MGHREDLLEGAKRCLLHKGFRRTTARDIVKESGTNLASIGYHYGSKDELLAQAYVALIEGVGERFAPAPAEEMTQPPGSLEHFQEVWAAVIRTVPEARPIWLLSFELMFQDERLAEVRKLLAKAQEEGRGGLAALFGGIPEADVEPERAETEGRLYQTLLNGLMVQWLFDPDTATTAEQLTEGLRRVIDAARGR
ncbi:TetR/AcrR family transcriptional regulator [Streptomyces achromogenes]|uniref:TetR/AcrR family transcriptional regulator n=1 Tax=Streptomyces achromogenes TaxID=67255 RepID=UPI0036FDC451